MWGENFPPTQAASHITALQLIIILERDTPKRASLAGHLQLYVAFEGVLVGGNVLYMSLHDRSEEESQQVGGHPSRLGQRVDYAPICRVVPKEFIDRGEPQVENLRRMLLFDFSNLDEQGELGQKFGPF